MAYSHQQGPATLSGRGLSGVPTEKHVSIPAQGDNFLRVVLLESRTMYLVLPNDSPVVAQMRALAGGDGGLSSPSGWLTGSWDDPGFGQVMAQSFRADVLPVAGVPFEKYVRLERPGTGPTATNTLRATIDDRNAPDYGYSYAIVGPAYSAAAALFPGYAYVTGVWSTSPNYQVEATRVQPSEKVVLSKEETGLPYDQTLDRGLVEAARESVANRGGTYLAPDASTGIFLCRLADGSTESVPQAEARTAKLRQYGYYPDGLGSDCAKALQVYAAILEHEAGGGEVPDDDQVDDQVDDARAPYAGDGGDLWSSPASASSSVVAPVDMKKAAVPLALAGLAIFFLPKLKL